MGVNNKKGMMNILTIMSDQHSPHVLGCYGDSIVRTPNLDRLAAQGMRFSNTYCAAPLCVPSRMSFMTGRTPTNNRCWDNAQTLHSAIPTWAHVLGGGGYETALLGRMHFVGPDQRHGFEHRPISEYMAGFPGADVQGGPMWDRYPEVSGGQSRAGLEMVGHGRTHFQLMDEQVTDTACDWLAEKATRGGRPFAATVSWILPHCPFIAPRDLFEYYLDRVEVPEVESEQPATVTRFRQLRGVLDPPVATERVRQARAAYYALCEYVDGMLGRVLDVLDETGLADDTLVVYCSDHGEAAGEHGCWWKSTYYESSARVPMIARLPGVVAPGTTCDAVTSLIDLAPTFAELAGTQFPTPIDGRSLWPTLQGRHPTDWLDETFSELVDPKNDRLLASRMIRSGPWKLWAFVDEDELPPAMYNLEADPGEVNDLAIDAAHAAKRDELLARLHEQWDPHDALATTRAELADSKVIQAWGQAVQPMHPDHRSAPPAACENDVELL